MRIIPITEAGEPQLSPDLVWTGVMADLALADPSEAGNRGGLQATHPLETAVLICLMTDARAEPAELRDGDENRGWHGDTYDLAGGEAPIGSKLWLLMRRTVDDVHVPRLAESYALEALQVLIDQGAAAKAAATATADPANNRLMLSITLTDCDGRTIVAPNYQILWSNLDHV